MKEETFAEALKVLGEDIVTKVMDMTDEATDRFIDRLEKLVEQKRKDKDAREWKPTKQELIKQLTGFGFDVPDNAKFYKFRDKSETFCYGMQVGQYSHSCYIDTTDYIILLIVKDNNTYVKEVCDFWTTQVL